MATDASDLKVQDAKRTSVFLSLMLAGPSGSGKTYSALRLAKGLAGSGVVVLIDTETKPATLYADEFKFKRIALPRPFSPERYREALKMARALKPSVVIVDSVTHEWLGSGGILPELDKIPGTNNMIKWKDLTPRHDRFVESVSDSSRCHVIVCCRAKERYTMDTVKRDDGTTRTEVKRVGLRPIQRRDFFYDFMLSFVIDPDTHNARVLNNTTKTFRDYSARPLTEKDGAALAKWCAEGGKAKS